MSTKNIARALRGQKKGGMMQLERVDEHPSPRGEEESSCLPEVPPGSGRDYRDG
jgi:hypothetical protein